MSMTDLRTQIDALDGALIDMLVERAGYINRAITLKQNENLPARINDRVEDVVQKVRAKADASGFDADLAETLWRHLIEWSIAREEQVLAP